MEKTAENRPAFSSQMRMIDFHAHLSFEGEAEWRQKQGILTCFSAGTAKTVGEAGAGPKGEICAGQLRHSSLVRGSVPEQIL